MLGDRGIQRLQEKVFEWKECVQREWKEQEGKSKALVIEARMSHGKSSEISKLRTDFEQAVQEEEVQITLFLHNLHALSSCHAYV